VERQHGVVARWQLLEIGFSANAINHRVANGRLHPVCRGVYAVGRPNLTRKGRWMAAVLSCGPGAVLSHESAAALWEIRPFRRRPTDVSVPAPSLPRRPGIAVHRRKTLAADDVCTRDNIAVTSPLLTLVDLATRIRTAQLEAAINEADKRDLIDPEELRSGLDGMPGRRGVRLLKRALDRRTFRLTDSELERRFLSIVRSAGLPMPDTGRVVNGFKVDFLWPNLELVVETDGLRYHRTPAQQARDRTRDQTHTMSGLAPLRFTHAQIRYEPRCVERTLRAVALRLAEDVGVRSRRPRHLAE